VVHPDVILLALPNLRECRCIGIHIGQQIQGGETAGVVVVGQFLQMLIPLEFILIINIFVGP
jgi:hypothetical protein